MIIILNKSTKPDSNEVKCDIAIAHEGIHNVGTLHFPSKITWSRFAGAMQNGVERMRDMEVRIETSIQQPKEEESEAK